MKLGILVAALLATACTTQTNDAPQGPVAYRTGYASGCDSGYVAAGHPYYSFKKAVNKYDRDSIYRQGWDDGFAVCKGRYDNITR